MAVVEATFFGRIFGQQTQNIFHFYRPDVTQAQINALVVRLREAFYFDWQGQMLSDWEGTRTHVRCIDGGNFTPVDEFYSIHGSAGNSSFQTSMLAFCITKKTALAGRRGRGRFYLPGASAGKLSQGRWLNTVQNIFADVHTETMHKWGPSNPTEGWNMVLWGGAQFGYTLITSLVLRDVASCQRRRNIGYGN